MKPFPIDVRAVGAVTHAEDDEELQYLAMPREMNTFRMPQVPVEADAAAMTRSRDTLAAMLRELEQWDPAGEACGPRIDLSTVPADALVITNEMLGEGEVSIQIGGARPFRIQESVFTGLWRVCEFDADGACVGDWLEAAALPRVALDAARNGSCGRLASVELFPGTMNSPALLHEIAAQMENRPPASPAHVVNLTLFPMTEDDHRVLATALPPGPVAIMSRGFGNCRITSTTARDVWRVQYFNSMNTLILNTIEVVAVPEVALAATEDLADTRTRLAELVLWMSESCPA